MVAAFMSGPNQGKASLLLGTDLRNVKLLQQTDVTPVGRVAVMITVLEVSAVVDNVQHTYNLDLIIN